MMENPEESMVEEREEFMVSPTGGNPFLKNAYFLKPTLPSSINEPPFKLPCHFQPNTKSPLKVDFREWQSLPKEMIDWAGHLASTHQFTWKKAGICEAIFISMCDIRKQNDLIYGLGEKWCSDTNTFIFPWGEATITLEDVMVLGGFSVLGDSVLSPLETTELKETEKKLNRERKILYEKGSRIASTSQWLHKFMNSGDEIEHEAFLAFWLSRYVFHGTNYNILKQALRLAVLLARGTRIALAPAVLASIYRNLGLLKRKIVASNQLKIGDAVAAIELSKSPLQLVQVWAWERFLELRPKPNAINYAEPRMTRWDKVHGLKVKNLRMILDSAGNDFNWRPYAIVIENWRLPKYYPQEEKWVLVGPDLDDEVRSFVRCLRVNELVGVGTIEHYLPHRVAMQFGYDQDLPWSVTRRHQNSDLAWKHYMKEIKNVNVYLPSRLSEADVSTKYFEWWKQSMLGLKDTSAAAVPPKKKAKSIDCSLLKGDHPALPPCFPPKCRSMEVGDSMDEDKLTISEYLQNSRKHENVEIRQDGECEKLSSQVEKLPSQTEETSIHTMKSDKGMIGIVGTQCPGSSSLFQIRLLELEKRDSELKARFIRLESVVEELKAHTCGTS